MVTTHGTCIRIRGTGVLLRGPSGCGKSDLALRLIDHGADLVADDRVELRLESGQVVAVAPEALAGLIEVRGVGIVRLPFLSSCPVGLVVDLVPREAVERLPPAEAAILLDRPLARLALCAFDASTPAKLRLAAAAAGSRSLGEVPVCP